MNKRTVVILLLALGLSACASSERSALFNPESDWIGPQQAIFAAAEAAPAGIQGTFAMTVQASGLDGEILYLNSELDYRDQRSLNIALLPRAVQQLSERLGGDPADRLIGEDILIRGVARRMRIIFTNAEGEPSGRYYYQTQVAVREASQVTVL